jgi:heme A synthase
VFTALLVLAIIAAVLWQASSVSIEAEKTLHAYHVVLDVVGVYLGEHGGTWPTNWEALMATPTRPTQNMWRWPEEAEEMRKRVAIDFSLQTHEVASMSVDNFTAIQMIGPQYHATTETRRFIERASKALD